jgi:hypothetical protein
MSSKGDDPDFKAMSEAVQAWYPLYQIDPKKGLSYVLSKRRSTFIEKNIIAPTTSQPLLWGGTPASMRRALTRRRRPPCIDEDGDRP